jgi:serine/threonine protein kinase
MLTKEGLFVGTPDFVAPEQAVNPHLADARSDLYSLGCTFYFLLSGTVPFPGGSSVHKLLRHSLEEPKPVDQLRPDVNGRVANIVRRLMAKDPNHRHQTALELVREIEALGSHSPPIPSPGGAISGGSQEKVSTSAASHLSARKWLTGAAAIVLLLGGTALMTLLLAGSPANSRPTPAAPMPRSASSQPLWNYVRRPTRTETVLATLKANNLPTLEGKWHIIGPFDSDHNDKGFDTVYPPEQEIKLDKSYPGKSGKTIRWKEFPAFQLGAIVNLRLFDENDFACVYLFHTFDVAEAIELPVGLGSDDTLTVWLNGEQLLAKKLHRGVVPDEDHVVLACKRGRNELLLKIVNHNGAWAVWVMPSFPPALDKAFGDSLKRDFPQKIRK